jgi:hypothetical protein
MKAVLCTLLLGLLLCSLTFANPVAEDALDSNDFDVDSLNAEDAEDEGADMLAAGLDMAEDSDEEGEGADLQLQAQAPASDLHLQAQAETERVEEQKPHHNKKLTKAKEKRDKAKGRFEKAVKKCVGSHKPKKCAKKQHIHKKCKAYVNAEKRVRKLEHKYVKAEFKKWAAETCKHA